MLRGEKEIRMKGGGFHSVLFEVVPGGCIDGADGLVPTAKHKET